MGNRVWSKASHLIYFTVWSVTWFEVRSGVTCCCRLSVAVPHRLLLFPPQRGRQVAHLHNYIISIYSPKGSVVFNSLNPAPVLIKSPLLDWTNTFEGRSRGAQQGCNGIILHSSRINIIIRANNLHAAAAYLSSCFHISNSYEVEVSHTDNEINGTVAVFTLCHTYISFLTSSGFCFFCLTVRHKQEILLTVDIPHYDSLYLKFSWDSLVQFSALKSH